MRAQECCHGSVCIIIFSGLDRCGSKRMRHQEEGLLALSVTETLRRLFAEAKDIATALAFVLRKDEVDL